MYTERRIKNGYDSHHGKYRAQVGEKFLWEFSGGMVLWGLFPATNDYILLFLSGWQIKWQVLMGPNSSVCASVKA